jgi:hypothetical protein
VTSTEGRLYAYAEGFDADGRRVADADAAEYFIAGVWDGSGRLLWSSEPESFRTAGQALRVAWRKVDDLEKKP